MFKVNDYIVYGSTGVCQITDISRDESIGNGETEYYVMKPAFNDNMIIKIPVNNPQVMMRRVIKKDDVSALIQRIPQEDTTWIDNEKQRRSYFTAALKTGKSEELIKVIITIHREKEARSAVGRKLTKTDEDIMNAAEKQLYEELAVAMSISPDEAVEYVRQNIL